MTNRRRRWLRRLAIGVSLAAFAAPAAAKPIPGPNSMRSRSGRTTGRIGSPSPSRRSSRAPWCARTTARIGSRSPTAPRRRRQQARLCGRTTARIGSQSRTAPRGRQRARQAFPGMGPSRSDWARSCSSWPSASGSGSSVGPKSPKSKFAGAAKRSGLFGARFRLILRSLPTRSLARVRPAAPRTGCEAPRRS